jgi:hypothetical protein
MIMIMRTTILRLDNSPFQVAAWHKQQIRAAEKKRLRKPAKRVALACRKLDNSVDNEVSFLLVQRRNWTISLS